MGDFTDKIKEAKPRDETGDKGFELVSCLIPQLQLPKKKADILISLNNKRLDDKIVRCFSKLNKKQLQHILHKLEHEHVRIEFGERLLLLIDRFMEKEKADFLGKVLTYLANDKITPEEFMEIGYALEKCYFEDLGILDKNTNEMLRPDWDKFNRQNQQVYSRLVGAGIFGVNVYDGSLSNIGSKIIHIMRDSL